MTTYTVMDYSFHSCNVLQISNLDLILMSINPFITYFSGLQCIINTGFTEIIIPVHFCNDF